MVVCALSGSVGLIPTLAAVQARKNLALANKEPLVMAGEILVREAQERGLRIPPIDSEHSAIFQALAGHRKEDVRRIILTASGGPFLQTPLAELARVTPQQALIHPQWRMGKKVTIDSASLMNKGLEVIEAHWLFSVPPSQIEVRIHPQSIVHSMVEYIDGSIIAQMAIPDMRGPIAYALSYPERLESKLASSEPSGDQPADFPARWTRSDSRPWVWRTGLWKKGGRCPRSSMRPTKWPWRLFCGAVWDSGKWPA